MIELYTGRIGSGKTYSAVLQIAKYMANGAFVVTNVSIDRVKICKYILEEYGRKACPLQLHIMTTDDAVKDSHRIVPCGRQGRENLICIDEAQIWFSSRNWKATGQTWLEWLSQSRKAGVDVILITQHEKNVDVMFSRLAQYVWRFKDMRTLKFPWFGIGYPIPQILQAQYDIDGRTLLCRFFIMHDKRVYQTYQSFKLLREFDGLQAVSVGKAPRVKKLYALRQWAALFMLASVIIGIGCARKEVRQAKEDAAAIRAMKQDLQKLLSSTSAGSEPITKFVTPTVTNEGARSERKAQVRVSSIERGGYWLDAAGRRHLEIDGMELQIGDYFMGGTVVGFDDRKLLCKGEDGMRLYYMTLERAGWSQKYVDSSNFCGNSM